MPTQQFPFRRGDVVTALGGSNEFIIRLVDDEAYEAYAERRLVCKPGELPGVRIISPENWEVVTDPIALKEEVEKLKKSLEQKDAIILSLKQGFRNIEQMAASRIVDVDTKTKYGCFQDIASQYVGRGTGE